MKKHAVLDKKKLKISAFKDLFSFLLYANKHFL